MSDSPVSLPAGYEAAASEASAAVCEKIQASMNDTNPFSAEERESLLQAVQAQVSTGALPTSPQDAIEFAAVSTILLLSGFESNQSGRAAGTPQESEEEFEEDFDEDLDEEVGTLGVLLQDKVYMYAEDAPNIYAMPDYDDRIKQAVSGLFTEVSGGFKGGAQALSEDDLDVLAQVSDLATMHLFQLLLSQAHTPSVRVSRPLDSTNKGLSH
jgi:hypothetical protein